MNKSMIYVYGQSLPNKYANSSAVTGLCNEFSKNGYSVNILYRKNNSLSRRDIINFYGLSEKVTLTPVDAKENSFQYIVFALATIRYSGSIIITRMPQVAIIIALLFRVVILELHQDLENYKKWNFWRFLSKMIVGKKIKLAALTESIVLKLDNEIKKVILNHCVIPSASEDFFCEKEPVQKFNVGYIGSFIDGKGIDKIYEIAKTMKNLSFVVYGDCEKNIIMKEKLVSLGNVYVGGFLEKKDIPRAMSGFDIGVAPYSRNGFNYNDHKKISVENMSSLKIIEYMSAQKIVLSSKLSGIESMVSGGCYILCDPDNNNEWCAAINEIMRNINYYKSDAKKNREIYLKNYSYRKRFSNFVELAE